MMHESLINRFAFVNIVAPSSVLCWLFKMLHVEIKCVESSLLREIQPYPQLALLFTIDVNMIELVQVSVLVGSQCNAG